MGRAFGRALGSFPCLNVCNGSKEDIGSASGTIERAKRCAAMDEGAQKLRSLARQSRAFAAVVAERQRARSLEALAKVYDRQANEIKLNELTPLSWWMKRR